MRWIKRKSAKTAKTARGKTSRRRPAPRWVRNSARAAGALALFGLALGGPTWLWQSGWLARAASDAVHSVAIGLGDAGLRVEQVYLLGRDNESADDIDRALGIGRGTPLLTVDLDAARKRIEKLSWVRVAAVERDFPNAIRVRVVERVPLALWQRGEKLALVDEEGVIITERNLQRFAHLLVIVGDDAPAHAGPLLAMLAREPDLMQRVNAAVRVGDRRWNIRMDNGVFVRLPEKDAPGAWLRFAQLERKHGLLKQDLLSIDLRIPDQLIVRTRAERPRLEHKVGSKGKDT